MIKIDKVNLSFNEDQKHVLKNITMEILDQEILAIVGESGCGKSLLLKMIMGLIKPSSGSITIDGIDINQMNSIKLRRLFGYVFQDICLFPHMTVAENISIILHLNKESKKKQLEKTIALLKLVQLDPQKYFDMYPDNLSGGEQQRIGIARALAANPKYLFMDEPFSAIDPIVCAELHYQIFHLREKYNKTIVFITHNIHEVLRLADRVAVFYDGKLEQLDEINKILTHPKSQYVKDLFTIADSHTQN